MDIDIKPCKRCKGINFKFTKIKNTNKKNRYCVDCNRKNVNNYVNANKDKYKALATNYTRLKLTGFTHILYEEKLIEQKYTCAICNTHVSKLKRSLSADHDHTTGIPRGLLCTRCNMLLGYAKDDISILASAKAYLEKYK